jgi:hypothetical protein
MTVAYSLEARLALVTALRDELPTPNEAKLLTAAASILGRLDEGGWCITTQELVEQRREAENARAVENRQYHYRPGRSGAEDTTDIIGKLDWIAGNVKAINDWINTVTELVESQFGVIIES